MSKEEDDQRKRFRDQQRRQVDEQRQRNLDAAAAAEDAAIQRGRDKQSDDDFQTGMSGLFGGTDLSKLKDIDWLDDKSVRDRIREMQKLQREGKKGAAAEIYKRQKNRIRKSVKRSSAKRDKEIKAEKVAGKKAGSGCGVVAILLVGTAIAAFGGAALGAVEIIGALIS